MTLDDAAGGGHGNDGNPSLGAALGAASAAGRGGPSNLTCGGDGGGGGAGGGDGDGGGGGGGGGGGASATGGGATATGAGDDIVPPFGAQPERLIQIEQ